jgi:hypothetical protein
MNPKFLQFVWEDVPEVHIGVPRGVEGHIGVPHGVESHIGVPRGMEGHVGGPHIWAQHSKRETDRA